MCVNDGVISFANGPTVCQHISLETLKEECVIRQAQSLYKPGNDVEVFGLTSAKGRGYNGLRGKITRLAKAGSTLAEIRWGVKLSNGIECSVAITNLKLYVEKSSMETLKALKDNPVFAQLLTQLHSGNGGFTTLMKPEFLPVLRQAVDGGVFGVPPPDHFLVGLSIAEQPKGESFRQFCLKMRAGATLNEVEDALSDPFFDESYKKLQSIGLLKPRSK
jgi:hypothetical protein